MSLSVTAVLREGLDRTFARNGLQLVAAFLVVRLATAVADQTLTRANLAVAAELGTFPSEFGGVPFPGLAETPTPFALGLGLGAAYVLFAAVAVLAEAVRLVAVRTFATDRTDAVPAADARRNLGPAVVNGVVGGLVVYTLTLLGLVVLVVPGLFLLAAFYFVRQEIALRDVTFVEAMSGSWALTAGHRFELFLLAVALVLAGLVASLPGFVVGGASPAAGAVLGAAGRAVVVVLGVASTTRAYVRLREAPDEAEEPPEDPYAGALGPDDLPPPDDRDGP